MNYETPATPLTPLPDAPKTTLCVECRAEFTDEEIKGAFACPKCGSEGVPGDLTQKATLTLTQHEWRIVFMWADNWARKCPPGSQRALASIITEAHKQAPTLPGLTMGEELQEVADVLGKKVEMVGNDGKSQEFVPTTKH